MHSYAKHIARRFAQFLLVVFIGINLTYVITHMTPIDPVEQSIAAVTSFGNTSPEAIAMMRQSLRELYGLTGVPIEQYINFWRRIAMADFGPSLSAFPTPVSALIARALPWTIGLLVTATLITWTLGNLLGGLAGYYQDKRCCGSPASSPWGSIRSPITSSPSCSWSCSATCGHCSRSPAATA
jgi:peptide/nickel transport system permease protein